MAFEADGGGKNGKDRRSFAFAQPVCQAHGSGSTKPFTRTRANGCERLSRVDKLRRGPWRTASIQ
jgi:hypothetical protein